MNQISSALGTPRDSIRSDYALELVKMPFFSQAEFQRIVKTGKIGPALRPIQPSDQVNVGESMWQAAHIKAPNGLDLQASFELLSSHYLFVTVVYKSRFRMSFIITAMHILSEARLRGRAAREALT